MQPRMGNHSAKTVEIECRLGSQTGEVIAATFAAPFATSLCVISMEKLRMDAESVVPTLLHDLVGRSGFN